MSYSPARSAAVPGPTPHIVMMPGGYGAPISGTWATGVAAWPATNLAIYSPFALCWSATLKKVAIANWTPVSGNFDIGIYNTAGVKLWSSGSTAHTGTSVLQVVDVSPDLSLVPGWYFTGLSFDNTTAQIYRSSTSAIHAARAGYYTEASAFPLPATATFAFDYSTAFQPSVMLSFGASI